MILWEGRGFDWRFGEVSWSGLPSLGRPSGGGGEIGRGISFRAARAVFLDFAALLKDFRVLLKVSVANANFCAFVESEVDVSCVE